MRAKAASTASGSSISRLVTISRWRRESLAGAVSIGPRGGLGMIAVEAERADSALGQPDRLDRDRVDPFDHRPGLGPRNQTSIWAISTVREAFRDVKKRSGCRQTLKLGSRLAEKRQFEADERGDQTGSDRDGCLIVAHSLVVECTVGLDVSDRAGDCDEPGDLFEEDRFHLVGCRRTLGPAEPLPVGPGRMGTNHDAEPTGLGNGRGDLGRGPGMGATGDVG